MNRERIILIASLLVIAAVPVVYFLNPFQTASADPRARLAGGTIYRMPSRNMEPTIREAREERFAFGDALPSGLRLAV